MVGAPQRTSAQRAEWFYITSQSPKLSPYHGSMDNWRKDQHVLVNLPKLIVISASRDDLRIFIHRDLLGSLDKAVWWSKERP